jgi:hypothetical protein
MNETGERIVTVIPGLGPLETGAGIVEDMHIVSASEQYVHPEVTFESVARDDTGWAWE